MHFLSFSSQKPWVHATSLYDGLRFHTFPSASFVLQVPGKRRSSSAWEFSPFGQLWRQLLWDLPQLPTIDFFSICCLQTKGQLIVFSGSTFIWRDFRFLFFICSLLFNLFPKLHLLWAHVRGKKKNANDICSNWFQQKTRDPWHHVFYLKRCLLEYLFWCAMETF